MITAYPLCFYPLEYLEHLESLDYLESLDFLDFLDFLDHLDRLESIPIPSLFPTVQHPLPRRGLGRSLMEV